MNLAFPEFQNCASNHILLGIKNLSVINSFVEAITLVLYI